jgi:hypothetical protein
MIRAGRAALVAAAVFVALLAGAAPARADDASYMDYLRGHGWGPQYPVEAMPGMMERTGHAICGQLHAGMHPEDIVASMRPNNAITVEAAQHELCPDTL